MITAVYLVITVGTILLLALGLQKVVATQTEIILDRKGAWGALLLSAALWAGFAAIEIFLGINWAETLIVEIAGDVLILSLPLIILYWRDIMTDFRDGALYGVYTGIGVSLAKWALTVLDSDWMAEALLMSRQDQVFDVIRVAFYGAEDALYFGVVGAFLGLTIGLLDSQGLERKLFSLMAGFSFALLWLLQFESLVTALFAAGLDREAEVILLVSSLGGTGLVLALINTAALSLEKKRAEDLLQVVIPLGVKLSNAPDIDQLLTEVVKEVQGFCKARAGILGLITDDDMLDVIVVRYPEKRLFLGGHKGTVMEMAPMPLTESYVLTTAVRENRVIHDTSGKTKVLMTTEVDNTFKWTHSLTLPLRNGQQEVMGVLQLFDARNESREVVPFDANLQRLMTSYALLSSAVLATYVEAHESGEAHDSEE